MKNFKNSISTNNRRLFIQLTVVAFFAVASLLVWQTAAQMQDNNNKDSQSPNGIVLTLGNYPNTMVTLGANTTITPDATPQGATSINVSTNSNFKGTFVANLTTGVVRVTNAHPAGSYLVAVRAFQGISSLQRTFTLTVTNGTACTGTVQFTNAADVPVGSTPRQTVVGDFNNDGNQDIATANGSSRSARL